VAGTSDVAGEEKKEGGAGTGSNGDAAPPATGSAEADLLVDTSTTDNTTRVPDANTNSPNPNDPLVELDSSFLLIQSISTSSTV